MYPTVCTPTKFCASSSVWQYGSMEFSSLTRAFYHLQFLVSKLGLVTVAAHPCNYSTTTPSQYRLNPNVRLNKRFYSMPTFTFSLSKEGLFIIQLSVLMSDTVCCTWVIHNISILFSLHRVYLECTLKETSNKTNPHFRYVQQLQHNYAPFMAQVASFHFFKILPCLACLFFFCVCMCMCVCVMCVCVLCVCVCVWCVCVCVCAGG